MAEYAESTGRWLLEPPFMPINQAVGLPRNLDPDAVATVSAHVEELKASGFIATEPARSGVDASIAPPA
jgi:polar amino acid transport system substrate-binding protein